MNYSEYLISEGFDPDAYLLRGEAEEPESNDNNLTAEELKNNLPPYYHLFGKAKSKFFKRLTKRYKTLMLNENKQTEIIPEKVTFDFSKNDTKKFFKRQKIF